MRLGAQSSFIVQQQLLVFFVSRRLSSDFVKHMLEVVFRWNIFSDVYVPEFE